MKKRKEWQDALDRLDNLKKQAKELLGKDSNFTVKDFEKYIQLLYGATFYNSLEEFYKICKTTVILSEEITNYIDCLGYDVIKSKYKVTEISDKSSNKSAMVFFNYVDNRITKVYLEGDNIGFMNVFGLFAIDGEKKIKKGLKQYYGMSERKAERLVKKLL